MRSGKDTAAQLIPDLLKKKGYFYPTSVEKFAAPAYEIYNYINETFIVSDIDKEFYQGIITDFIVRVEQLTNRKVDKQLQVELVDIVQATRNQRRNMIRGLCEKLRAWDPHVWVNFLALKHQHNSAAGICTIISDLRFLDEANWCQCEGIYRIRLDVSPEVQATRLLLSGQEPSEQQLSHVSETQLDNYGRFSARIANNGTLEELQEKLSETLDVLISQATLLRSWQA